jgi:hypothetical protein
VDWGATALSAVILTTLVAATAAGQATPVPAPSTPPCRTPDHRQFDFWIGHWDVTRPDGTPAGTNHIQSIYGGCALQEEWTSATGGYEGRSLNALGPDGRWHQTWVDTGGLLLQLAGGIRDGRMVMSQRHPAADGGTVLHEISWEPLSTGQVKQHWRSSNDDGRTWTDVFVGIYTRKR